MEERRLALHNRATSSKEEPVALKAMAKQHSKQKHNQQHQKQDTSGDSKMMCYTCKEPRHKARECPIWKTLKEECTKKGDAMPSVAEFEEVEAVLLCAKADAHAYMSKSSVGKWFLDSGASDHMCCDIKKFKDINL
ncbi:uncharacterized protein LOC135216531 [Macrobrachium nipponense]|uniref:uncharacterized protein LOC135216531 n=1 Tax=Macrobrachium nipponense TaxID=159736 RepID=UPI0030C7EE13